MDNGSPERNYRSSLMAHSTMLDQMITCQAMGCTVEWDKVAGTLDIHKDNELVVRAIQKGVSDANWIATFYDTSTITWEMPDGV